MRLSPWRRSCSICLIPAWRRRHPYTPLPIRRRRLARPHLGSPCRTAWLALSAGLSSRRWKQRAATGPLRHGYCVSTRATCISWPGDWASRAANSRASKLAPPISIVVSLAICARHKVCMYALVLQPGFKWGPPVPMTAPGALLVLSTPARPTPASSRDSGLAIQRPRPEPDTTAAGTPRPRRATASSPVNRRGFPPLPAALRTTAR